MELTLIVKSKSLGDDKLEDITRDLSMELNQDGNFEAKLPEESGSTGSKGDPITIGTIILLLLGGKGIVTRLIEVLKAYVERGNSLEFEFKKADGASMSFKTENFRQRDVKELSKDMAKFFGVPE